MFGYKFTAASKVLRPIHGRGFRLPLPAYQTVVAYGRPALRGAAGALVLMWSMLRLPSVRPEPVPESWDYRLAGAQCIYSRG